MQDEKNKVEAILFTTGRFVTVDELTQMCGIGSKGYLKDVLVSLRDDYDQRGASLEVVEQGNQWRLAIRKKYLSVTQSLLENAEMDKGTQETLAVIAYKQPVLQSEVVKIRGNGTYDHLKVLRELEFVSSEKCGRTSMLKLTSKFYEYFDVAEEDLDKQFSQVKEGSDDFGSQLGKAMKSLFG